MAALNRGPLAVGEGERGWSIYRKAILGMGLRQYSKEHENELASIFDARPGSEDWPKVGPWLMEHAKVIELTREAAAKPSMGFIFGMNGSIRDQELWAPWYSNPPTGGAVANVLLPHLNDLVELSHALEVDGRFAKEQSEGARLMTDIIALQNMAQQLHADGGFMVDDLVAMGMWNRGLDLAEEAVGDEKLKLSDEDLQKLAHLISRPKLAADLVGLSRERMMMHDLIQRCYTDDGSGDGHLTLEGYRFIAAIGPIVTQSTSASRAGEFWHEMFMASATPATAESRREAQAHYDQMMDIAEANIRRPMREANWRMYEQRAPEMSGDADKLKRPLAVVLGSNLSGGQRNAERTLGHRDGIVVGIALELYRRKHGQYPAGLEVLVPEYLPAIPEDRITGEAVKYRVVEGRPIVYSVGVDRDDDGGRMPKSKADQAERY